MIGNIKIGAGVSDRSSDRDAPRRDQDQPERRTPASAAAGVSPDLRLVIERDAAGVDLVYKLIDRATGAVVAELRRDQVQSLAQGEGYAAGQVISTKA